MIWGEVREIFFISIGYPDVGHSPRCPCNPPPNPRRGGPACPPLRARTWVRPYEKPKGLEKKFYIELRPLRNAILSS